VQKIENSSLQQSPNCHPIAVTNKYHSPVSIKILGYINPEQKSFWIRHVYVRQVVLRGSAAKFWMFY